MKFKIDENLPAEVLGLLQASGHDACSVLDQNLGGQEGPLVAAACNEEAEARIRIRGEEVD